MVGGGSASAPVRARRQAILTELLSWNAPIDFSEARWESLMAMKRFPILDADSHVFEPAEIWTEYLEPEYRVAARSAFYFSQGSNGLCTVILNGRPAPAIDSSRLNRRAIWR